ncbi:MAG: hypothetical protein ACK48D_01025, partial [Pseudanabaena sp.]
MINSTDDQRRKYLEDRLTEIDTDIATYNSQLKGRIDQVDRNRIDRAITELFKDREEIEKQLKQLETSQNPYTSYENDWNQKIHILDFKQATKMFNDIFEKFEDREGAFIFLLKNSSD